jgi:hypothetical protein
LNFVSERALDEGEVPELVGRVHVAELWLLRWS